LLISATAVRDLILENVRNVYTSIRTTYIAHFIKTTDTTVCPAIVLNVISRAQTFMSTDTSKLLHKVRQLHADEHTLYSFYHILLTIIIHYWTVTLPGC